MGLIAGIASAVGISALTALVVWIVWIRAKLRMDPDTVFLESGPSSGHDGLDYELDESKRRILLGTGTFGRVIPLPMFSHILLLLSSLPDNDLQDLRCTSASVCQARMRWRCCLQVYKAVYHGALVAVKVFSCQDGPERQAIQREIDIVEGLRHPNVVSYMGHFFHAPNQVCHSGQTIGSFISRQLPTPTGAAHKRGLCIGPAQCGDLQISLDCRMLAALLKQANSLYLCATHAPYCTCCSTLQDSLCRLIVGCTDVADH